MLKLLGAALLTGGGVWAGLAWAEDARRRLEALLVWRDALDLMAGELRLRLPAMPDWMGELSRRARAPAGAVFAAVGAGLDRLGESSFGEVWSAELRRSPGGLAEGDLAALAALGPVLGRYGWEDQCRAIAAVREDLDRRAGEARGELERKGRTCGALGLSLGAFLTILLL